MNPTVTKLDREEHVGDWHDKPMRYVVTGVTAHMVQKFSTKKGAELWARITKKTSDWREASNLYIARA